MSVKHVLPVLGVGSAAVLFGLLSSRRSPRALTRTGAPPPRERPSDDAVPAASRESELSAAPLTLPGGFWDAGPDSALLGDEEPLTRDGEEPRPQLDGDELTADWLARATEAPPLGEDIDQDDPAEIPADSLSMISDASRYAAAFDDELDVPSERY